MAGCVVRAQVAGCVVHVHHKELAATQGTHACHDVALQESRGGRVLARTTTLLGS